MPLSYTPSSSRHLWCLLAFAALAVCLTANAAAAADEAAKTAAKKNLNEILKKSLSVKDVVCTPEAKTKLDKVIDDGVEQLAKDDFAPEKTKKAETNLKKLTAELKDKSKGEKVTEANVRDVLDSLCPLYPFCP